jgi:hypothetical protein
MVSIQDALRNSSREIDASAAFSSAAVPAVLTVGKLGRTRGRLEYYDAQVAAGAEDYYVGRGVAGALAGRRCPSPWANRARSGQAHQRQRTPRIVTLRLATFCAGHPPAGV